MKESDPNQQIGSLIARLTLESTAVSAILHSNISSVSRKVPSHSMRDPSRTGRSNGGEPGGEPSHAGGATLGTITHAPTHKYNWCGHASHTREHAHGAHRIDPRSHTLPPRRGNHAAQALLTRTRTESRGDASSWFSILSCLERQPWLKPACSQSCACRPRSGHRAAGAPGRS